MTPEPLQVARRRGGAALKRGQQAIRRLRAGDEESTRAGDGDETLQRRLDEATAEVERLRALVKKRSRQVRRWKQEVERTRDSVADPLPGLAMPERVVEVIDQVRAERLSLLEAAQLTALARQACDADRSGRPGLIIEAGTARGGSAIAMAAAKDPTRPMKVYDVFGLIPEPTVEDGPKVQQRYSAIAAGEARGRGGETYYGYRDDLFAEVSESFARLGVPVADNNVELVQGRFENTIDIDEPVALAHLDGDWYESTLTCLERITPHLVPGGRLVLDDYFYWAGCRKAVDEYFSGRPGYLLERRKKLHVVKL